MAIENFVGNGNLYLSPRFNQCTKMQDMGNEKYIHTCISTTSFCKSNCVVQVVDIIYCRATVRPLVLVTCTIIGKCYESVLYSQVTLTQNHCHVRCTPPHNAKSAMQLLKRHFENNKIFCSHFFKILAFKFTRSQSL